MNGWQWVQKSDRYHVYVDAKGAIQVEVRETNQKTFSVTVLNATYFSLSVSCLYNDLQSAKTAVENQFNPPAPLFDDMRDIESGIKDKL